MFYFQGVTQIDRYLQNRFYFIVQCLFFPMDDTSAAQDDALFVITLHHGKITSFTMKLALCYRK